jgi:hypothetical protein
MRELTDVLSERNSEVLLYAKVEMLDCALPTSGLQVSHHMLE